MTNNLHGMTPLQATRIVVQDHAAAGGVVDLNEAHVSHHLCCPRQSHPCLTLACAQRQALRAHSFDVDTRQEQQAARDRDNALKFEARLHTKVLGSLCCFVACQREL